MEIIACIQGRADIQDKHNLTKIFLVSGTINVVLEVILR
jgi:hypothetical protein